MNFKFSCDAMITINQSLGEVFRFGVFWAETWVWNGLLTNVKMVFVQLDFSMFLLISHMSMLKKNPEKSLVTLTNLKWTRS